VSASDDHHEAVTRRDVAEAWNAGRVEVYDESLTDDCVAHDPNRPEPARGREAFKQIVLSFRGAVPDLHVEIDDLIACDNKVVTRWTATGTERDSGRRIEVTGITIDRFRDGRVAESWTQWDRIGLQDQLATGRAKAASA
jgi:steroid delta-isomerase-like uncharacterized protein